MKWHMRFNLLDIAKIVHGSFIGDSGRIVTGLSIDSRKIEKDEIFVAIKGERFNGEDFVEQAMEKGASGAIVSKEFNRKVKNIIIVKDTVEALGRLAKYYRSIFRNLKVIGITGSTGKTTTKEMIYYALRNSYKVVRNEKSYNNFIGVPLTIFSIAPQTEILISEIGTNHPDEIDKLTDIVRPHIAIVTSIGPSHLEFFGTVRNVAIEKSDILKYLPPDGVAILNRDMPYFNEIIEAYPVNYIMTVSTKNKKSDFYAEINYMDFERNEITINGKYQLILHPGGMGTVYGALFSLAVAKILNVPIEVALRGLNEFHGVNMRKEVVEFDRYRILNDAYNANPDSMRDFLITLRPYREDVLLVLGDMFELGEYAEFYHREVGRLVKELGFRKLITIGEMSHYTSLEAGDLDINLHLESVDDVVNTIEDMPEDKLFIAIKASRAMQLEKIIEKLRRQ